MTKQGQVSPGDVISSQPPQSYHQANNRNDSQETLPSSSAYPPPAVALPKQPVGVIPPTNGQQQLQGVSLTITEAAPLSSQVVYRKQPVKVVCIACGSLVQTNTVPKVGVAMGGSIFALIGIGCYLGCCLLPLCVRDMYDTKHICPNCQVMVGIHQVIKF